MATQKENGHDSDTPPKLQQLPGRSSNKLQGRLYSNAGRGYDRESLQKMSAGEGLALVAPVEQQEGLAGEEEHNHHNDNGLEAATSHRSKNNHNIKHYLSGAALFLAGVIVGNVVIPLLTATGSVLVTENVMESEVSTNTVPASASASHEAIDLIVPITSKPIAAGCDINTVNTTGVVEKKEALPIAAGCGINTTNTTGVVEKKEAL